MKLIAELNDRNRHIRNRIAKLAGAFDLDLEFIVRTQDDLKCLLEEINSIDGVLRTEVSVRLELIRQSL